MASRMLLAVGALILLPNLVSARGLMFPPLSGVERIQQSLRDDDGIDISTGSEFHGLTTFASLPYANCFTDDWSSEREDAYDIALIGAPFDTVSLVQEHRIEPESLRTRCIGAIVKYFSHIKVARAS